MYDEHRAIAPDAGVQLDEEIARFARGRRLSPQEHKVLRLVVAHGLSMKEVAAQLGTSRKTVEQYWSRIYGKTGARSQLEVVAAFVRCALLSEGRC